MALWGKNTSDESKPKNLTTAQKREVYANNLMKTLGSRNTNGKFE